MFFATVSLFVKGVIKLDTFAMLKELLEQNQFELLLPAEEKEIRLVYQMNDTIESFLVFKEAKMTGSYKENFEGVLHASLHREGEKNALIVRQGDSVVTVLFEDLKLEVHLYNYGDIAHFWRKGYEDLRQLEFRIAILWDKCEYLGEDVCNEEEKKLVQLAYFPPLNYCCYPAVADEYIVPRDNPWIPSYGAFELMREIAVEAEDKSLLGWLKIYQRYPYPFVAKYLAALLHRNSHTKAVNLITERLKRATAGYGNRSFGKETDEKFHALLKKAELRKEEMEKNGISVEVLREEPFTIAKDTLDFHVYLLIKKRGMINRKIEIEEVR